MGRNTEDLLPPPPFPAIVCAGAERATGKLAPKNKNGRRVYQGPVSYYPSVTEPEVVKVIYRDGNNLYVESSFGFRFWVFCDNVVVAGDCHAPSVVQHSFFDLCDER